MAKFWIVEDKYPRVTDCFVVLSYAVKNNHLPTRLTCALIEKVHELRKFFPKASVILSTGDNQKLGITNAEVMAVYAQKIGIPKKYIIEERQSVTTMENLQYSKQLITRFNFKNPTLITLDLHTKRTLAIARTQGWNKFNWISVYAKGDPAYGWKRFQTISRLNIFLYEILAYIYCIIHGDIIFDNTAYEDF